MLLSKSQYLRGLQCLKSLWLYKSRSELRAKPDTLQEALFERGYEVGDLAKELFAGGIEVEFDPNNFNNMIQKTKELIANGVQIIYEATFKERKIFAMADILVRDGDGWNMYEVKSSTKVKEYHFDDAAIQWYALSTAIKLHKAYIIHINNQYERHGELEIHKLFAIKDITDEVLQRQKDIPNNLSIMQQTLQSDEPNIDIGLHCFDPFECDFLEYCWKDVPKFSVFRLYRMNGTKKFELYYQGVVSYEDIDSSNIALTRAQKLQIDTFLHQRVHIDKEKIDNFLKKIQYPISFLDFETFQEAIPRFYGQRPYQQIPFQYSLHILYEDGTLVHKEFLADENVDPRPELAKRLLQDIAPRGTIVAFNKSFEIRVIKELASYLTQYQKQLLSLIDRFEDLIEPFRGLGYYHPDFHGSFSIKSVLPALFPEDDELDYKKLGSVQNGGEAMEIFARLHLLKDKSKRDEIQKDLLAYCKLDTLAMVRIYERLKVL